MRPSSSVQFTAFEHEEAPPVEKVREGIWSIANPMPRVSNGLAATLCYLIEGSDGAVHIIDAGINHDAGFEAVRQGIEQTGHTLDDLATIAVTHLHTDHLGMAARLREASGARIALHSREQWALDNAEELNLVVDEAKLAEWGVPEERKAEQLAVRADTAHPEEAVHAELLLESGDELPIASRHLRVLPTPGHTPGSMSIVAPEEKLVFTGDALLPVTHTGIGLGGAVADPVGDYLRSMRDLAEYEDYEACPGHEFRFTAIVERCKTNGEHQLRRSREVAAIVAAEPDATVWQIASRLHWTAGFDGLKNFYLRSALAQTVMHRDFVRTPGAAEFLDA